MANKNKRNGRLNEKRWLDFFSRLFNLKPRVINPETKLPNYDWEIARAEDISQHYDNLGIDLIFKPKHVNFAVQCKETTVGGKSKKPIDVQPLEEIQYAVGEIPLLCTTVFRKTNKSRRVYGSYITIKEEDFHKLINQNFKR